MDLGHAHRRADAAVSSSPLPALMLAARRHNMHQISLRPRRSGARGRAGFTMLEIMVSVAILMVAVSGMASAMLSSMQLNRVNGETTLAHESARQVLETVQSQEFDEVFELYNANPLDDPGGPGVGPGADFAVAGLRALPGDADGLVGEVLFPTQGAQLREDVVDASWGMPRDLNADGVIDALDHAADRRLLPVRVRVQWQGVSGRRVLDFETILSGR